MGEGPHSTTLIGESDFSDLQIAEVQRKIQMTKAPPPPPSPRPIARQGIKKIKKG